jgi:hypothetical protein
MNGVVAAALQLIGDGRLARARKAFDQIILPAHGPVRIAPRRSAR